MNKVVDSEMTMAYGDCNGIWPDRDLNFQASEKVNVEDAVQIMCKALDVPEDTEGYNCFKPSLLRLLPEDSKIILAREGSVCVYVEGKVEYTPKLECDEFSFDDGYTRIWWD